MKPTYARLDANGVVIEVFYHEDIEISAVFPPALLAEFQECPAGVESGWTLENGQWVEPPPPADQPTLYKNLDPETFYLAFTVQEAIAIKRSTDPIVIEFFARLKMRIDTGRQIDPNSASTKAGLEYLSTTMQKPATVPASTYIFPERIPEILDGVPK